MRLIWITTLVSLVVGSWLTNDFHGPMQKLVTPLIFSKISPNLQNAMTVKIIQDPIHVSEDMIRIMFRNISKIIVTSCKITCINWNPNSGFRYQQKKLGFLASLNYSLIIKYETKSLMFPSSTVKIAVNDALFNMNLGFEQNLDAIDPTIKVIQQNFGKIKMGVSRMRLQVLKPTFSKMIHNSVEPFIRKRLLDSLSSTLKGIATGISNATILKTQIANAPTFSTQGIVFDLDLIIQKHLFLLEKRWWNPFKSNDKRGPPTPALGTELQTWLNVDSASIIEESIMLSLGRYLKKIRFGASKNYFQVSKESNTSLVLSDFLMKHDKVHWGRDSKVEFTNGSISFDLVLSFSGTSNYISSNTSVFPNGKFIGSIDKFHFSTSTELYLVDDILTSNITVTSIGMNSIQDSSLYRSAALTRHYQSAIQKRLSVVIKDALNQIIPDFFSNSLQPNISVPLIGGFETRFLQAPRIDEFGISADVVLNGENIEESDIVYEDWVCFRL